MDVTEPDASLLSHTYSRVGRATHVPNDPEKNREINQRNGILHHRKRTPFQRSICIGCKSAVLKNEVVAVAERLRAGDTAADKMKVLCVPAEVLATEIRVIDGDVLAVPEGVRGVEDGIVDLYIAGVLESVLALQLEIGDLTMEGMQEGVVCIMHLYISQPHILTMPKTLDSIGNFGCFNGNIFKFTKSLRSVYLTVGQAQIPAVPHRRPI